MKTINTFNEIDIKDMVENYWDGERFLELCKNCGNYGKLWSCPPYDFHVQNYIKQYRYAYIIGTKMVFDTETINENNTEEKIGAFTKSTLESMRNTLGEKLLKLEKDTGQGKSLYAGSCILCQSCTREDNGKCSNVEMMRYSLESLGFDVAKIAEKLLNIELKWASDSLPEYFTLVSAFLSNEKISDFNTQLSARFNIS
jgi:predicted metal-binding protein